MFQGFRANSAPVSGSTSVTMNGAVALRDDAEDPFDVRGHGETPGLAGPVLDRQPRDLHRVVHRARTGAGSGRCRATYARSGCSPDRAGRRRATRPPGWAARSGPRARRSLRRGRRWSRPGGSVTGSLDQGVSWFSRLLSDHVYPAPDSETWKPNAGLATTLIQGAGVHCPSPRTVTYSRPSSTKPPRPLKNSNSGRARRGIGGGWAARAGRRRGGSGRARARRVARESCSARVPCRLRRMARAAACRASRSAP